MCSCSVEASCHQRHQQSQIRINNVLPLSVFIMSSHHHHHHQHHRRQHHRRCHRPQRTIFSCLATIVRRWLTPSPLPIRSVRQLQTLEHHLFLQFRHPHRISGWMKIPRGQGHLWACFKLSPRAAYSCVSIHAEECKSHMEDRVICLSVAAKRINPLKLCPFVVPWSRFKFVLRRPLGLKFSDYSMQK